MKIGSLSVGVLICGLGLGTVCDAQVIQRRGAPPPSPTVARLSPEAAMAGAYDRMPGCAKRISIASLTRIYVIGCSDTLDVKTFKLQFDTWVPLNVDAHAIAAVEALPYKEDKSGNLVSGLLAIRANGRATFADAGTAAFLGGTYTKVQEVATGGGWIWAINEASGNHLGGTVRRADGVPQADCDKGGLFVGDQGICSDYQWNAFGDLYARRIAAGLTDAVAWAIGEDGKIYRQVNSGVGWTEMSGCASSIANAGKDNVWVIGCDTVDGAGNRTVFKWDGSTWVKQVGTGVEVALQPDGKSWLVQADGSIWRQR